MRDYQQTRLQNCQFTQGTSQNSEQIFGSVAATTYDISYYYITRSNGTSVTLQITDTDTKYDVAESDKDGMMSKEDYYKLFTIEIGLPQSRWLQAVG